MNRPHPYFVLLWAASIAIPLFVVRNPVYVTILLASLGLVFSKGSTPKPRNSVIWRFWFLSFLLFSVLATTLQAFFSHRGITPLFELPASWPLVGGPVFVEAFAYGFSLAYALVTLLFLFVQLSTLIPVTALVRIIPNLFSELTTVLIIAFQFLPRSLRMVQVIREAQISRGHRFLGLKGQIPLVSAALAQGLEESMEMAEAMECRGLGFVPRHLQRTFSLLRTMAALGLFLVATSLLCRLFFPLSFLCLVGTGLGVLTVFGSIWLWRTWGPRSRGWKVETLRKLDWLGMVYAGILLLTFLAIYLQSDSTRFYNPYEKTGLLPPLDLSLLAFFLAYIPLSYLLIRKEKCR